MLVIFKLNTNGETIFKTRDDLPRKDIKLFELDDYIIKCEQNKQNKPTHEGIDYK